MQSIRDHEATTSKELIFFNAVTDVLITSRKIRVAVANSGKTMTFYKSIQAFPKISKNYRFRSFELLIIRMDSCGPWSFVNNRGLTVYLFYSSTPGDISVTIGGADCAVTSASNTELECVTGPHTLSDYIFILQFHSTGHQCDYLWCRLCCYISQ